MMPTSLRRKYASLAAQLLNEELDQKQISHQRLSMLLAEAGYDVKAKEITTKLNQGDFSAAFFFFCLKVVGAKFLVLPN